MTEQFRIAFNKAVVELDSKKDQSSTFLSEDKYKYILSRLDDIRLGVVKKEARDYRLIKSYAKQSILIQGILVQQLYKPRTALLYLSTEQL